MEYFIGVTLALVTCLAATLAGLDRDRAFYPTITIAIASFYALFAVMSGSLQILVIESVVITTFCAASFVGFRTTLWLVAAALVAHGTFDFFHRHFISSTGVPVWWPAFCLSFDVVAGLYLSWLLATGRTPARGTSTSTSPLQYQPDDS